MLKISIRAKKDENDKKGRKGRKRTKRTKKDEKNENDEQMAHTDDKRDLIFRILEVMKRPENIEVAICRMDYNTGLAYSREVKKG